MKKNEIRYIDDTTAQVTKAFAKNACIFNSPEFKLWREYKAMFPAAEMVTKTIKRKSDKRTYKNLTYANMERFLKVQPNGKALVEEFKQKKEEGSIQESPYRAVLAWFLEKFPQYDEYKEFFADKDNKGSDNTKQKDEDAAEADTKKETAAPENAAPTAEEEATSNAIPFGKAANFS